MMAAREPLPSLDRVKTFIEVKEDNELKMILNDVIGWVETLRNSRSSVK